MRQSLHATIGNTCAAADGFKSRQEIDISLKDNLSRWGKIVIIGLSSLIVRRGARFTNRVILHQRA
jgi:hypothetical protein